MHLFALIAVTMCAFAANSVLSRAGIFTYGMDPIGFSGVRLFSGAVMLAVLVSLRGRWPRVDIARALTAGSVVLSVGPGAIA